MTTFEHETIHQTMKVKLFFNDGDLERVEVKHVDEVVKMSPMMFFAIFQGDAFDIYEKAAKAHQNATL